MALEGWKWVRASVPGTSHIQAGLPCQDACDVRHLRNDFGDDFLILVVSDGAGSALKGIEGATLACRALIEEVDEFIREFGTLDTAEAKHLIEWVSSVRRRIGNEAVSSGLTLRDYACTLLAAVVSDKCAVYLQIGDGAMIVPHGESYRTVFWPQSGEYINTTNFVTDPAVLENLRVQVFPGQVDEIALFTDGIQMLALHYQTKSVHRPFFSPMFERLRVETTGEQYHLEDALQDFLRSDRVNERTDDDKTLILATRQTPGNSLHKTE